MDSRKKALSHFRNQLRKNRPEELPVKKVTVASDSAEGLKEGLEKAEDLLENPKKMMGSMMPEMEGEEYESEESEGEESEDEMEDEGKEMMKASCSDEMLQGMSREQLVEKVKELRELL